MIRLSEQNEGGITGKTLVSNGLSVDLFNQVIKRTETNKVSKIFENA